MSEILVTDNGRGMSAEKLAEIQAKLIRNNFEHTANYNETAVYWDCEYPRTLYCSTLETAMILVLNRLNRGIHYRIAKFQDEEEKG